jgi:hypothetical protein
MRKPHSIAMFAAATATVAIVIAGSAAAGVYKCVDVDGKQTIYQDSPCLPGRELRNFDTEPAELSVIPFRVVPDAPPVQAAPKPGKAPPVAKSDKKNGTAPNVDIAQRKFIVAGMSEGEVVARIGAPDITRGGKGSKSSRWSYLPAPGDPQTITSLVFDYGIVTQVERKTVK